MINRSVLSVSPATGPSRETSASNAAGQSSSVPISRPMTCSLIAHPQMGYERVEGAWGNREVPPHKREEGGRVGETWFPPRERAEGERRSYEPGQMMSDLVPP